jgi:hypothetical protein
MVTCAGMALKHNSRQRGVYALLKIQSSGLAQNLIPLFKKGVE